MIQSRFNLLRAVPVLVTGLLLIAGCASSRADDGRPVILGYYPSWSTNLAPEKIPFGEFTYVIHAFTRVSPEGLPMAEGNVPSQTLTRAAHAGGTRVLLGIGGGSNGKDFGKMVRNPEKMRAFVTAVVNMAQASGYDGLDIDWEYPEAGDEQALISFVETLRTELKARNPQGQLFMAMSRGNYYGQRFNVEKLRTLIDMFQVMVYDAHGPWSAHAGYNAALYEAESDAADGHVYSYQKAVDYWVGRGLSRDQILLGFPLYGYGYIATGWGQPHPEKMAKPEFSYKQVTGLLGNGWVRNWDAQAAVPWASRPGTNELISYDDEVSTQLKGAWTNQAGVKGYFFWNIEQDSIDGRSVLVEAARKGWNMAGDAVKLEEMRKTGVKAE